MNALATYDLAGATKDFAKHQSKVTRQKITFNVFSAFAVLSLINLIPMITPLFLLAAIIGVFTWMSFLRADRELELYCENQLTSFFNVIASRYPEKEAPECLFELIGIENTFMHPSVKFVTETYLVMLPRVKKVKSFKRLMKGLDSGDFKELF